MSSADAHKHSDVYKALSDVRAFMGAPDDSIVVARPVRAEKIVTLSGAERADMLAEFGRLSELCGGNMSQRFPLIWRLVSEVTDP